MTSPAIPAAPPPLLDAERLHRSDVLVRHAPFAFLIAENQLAAGAADALDRDFPRYRSAGFFPWEPAECGPTINRLIEELTAPAFAAEIGRILGIDDLGLKPSLVTICRHLNRRHGTIHTDSRSKIATALLYLNPSWPATSEGCLRFLNRIDDIDDVVAPEVRPIYGNFVVFGRADNSYHGHLPHEGERRVIQVAWLTGEEEKRRKTRRGRFSRWLKRLLGSLDRHFGAGRGPNAAHPR